MIKSFAKLYIILAGVLVFISIFLTGCNIIENLFVNDLMPKRVVKKSNVPSNVNQTKTYKPSNENEGKVESNTENSKISGEKYKVSLFFANKEATDFIQEERSINKVSALAKETILELIKGPNSLNKGAATIPKGTRLIDIIIKEDVCYVNFSKEFQNNHQGGSAGEYMTVFSIVKTLKQFSSISKVQILVEGKNITTLTGHLDISKPL